MSRRGFGLFVICAMVAFAIAVFPRLPAEIPTHWGLNGEVNDTMPKFPAVFLCPGIALLVWVLLPMLRKMDPRTEHYEKFDETFWILVNLVVLMIAVIEVLTLGYGLGWPIDMGRAIPSVIGVLFVGMGNYMPRVRSNWWMGIRTPWTLSNERVWRETHRVAGTAFVVAGIVALLSASLPVHVAIRLALCIGALMVASIVPIVYSYMIWHREAHQ